MLMIYAFRDEDDRWHGHPNAETGWATPGNGVMTYCPSPDAPAVDSPFAGQALEVRFAAMDGQPGPFAYRLDSNARYLGTPLVCDLLGDPRGGGSADAHARATRSDAADAVDVACARDSGTEGGTFLKPPADPLYVQAAEDGRNYDLHAEIHTIRDADHSVVLDVEVLGCGPDGSRRSHLRGEVTREDLVLVGRLFLAAATTSEDWLRGEQAVPEGASDTAFNRGAPLGRRRATWTPEEDEILQRRHHDGVAPEHLAAHLGRSVGAIDHRLHALGLGPYPDAAAPPRDRPAAEPA